MSGSGVIRRAESSVQKRVRKEGVLSFVPDKSSILTVYTALIGVDGVDFVVKSE